MKIAAMGLFNGELVFTVDGISGTDKGFRVDVNGVSDGFRHLEYCLTRLFEAGLIHEGQRLIGLASDVVPMCGYEPLPGEEVPGIRTITAFYEGGAVDLQEETTYY